MRLPCRVRCALHGHSPMLSYRRIGLDGSGHEDWKCECGRDAYVINFAPEQPEFDRALRVLRGLRQQRARDEAS